VRVGRDEIDLLAVDPGPPASLVFAEVRSTASGRFGAPEESIDPRKLRSLYRAARGLVSDGRLPGGRPLPRLRWRVDLVAVDVWPTLGREAGGPAIRHVRGLTAD